MTPTPTVSINLCCYNSERYLEETLQSVFAQTFTDWELVVVNDGSTDSTERIVMKHVADGWPIVYHAQTNAGLGRARNKALELSRGEFIALIDHDDIWHAEKLEQQAKLFAGRPEVGVVYSGSEVLVSDCQAAAPSLRRPMYQGMVLVPLLLSNFIACSTIVVRRAALDRVGRFDPTLRQVEEYDLMLRMAERYEFDYVNKPLSTFRYHPQNASWDGSQLQSELMTVTKRILTRNPYLTTDFGRVLTRIKQAGLFCTPGQAYVLQGRLQAARQWFGSWSAMTRALPRVVILMGLSILPASAVVVLIGWWHRMRRSRIVGSSS